jgi:type I restriction enzyme R subunit
VTPEAQPVAVALLEAKKNRLPPDHGLEQARLYADSKRLNVPFVFASNGYMWVMFDRSTGQTTQPRPMSEFPTPDELRERYESIMGFCLDSPAARPLLVRYPGGEGTRRYYQDAAIRATFEKLARDVTQGKPGRALLTLATGAGKTFIAVQLLKRIAEAGQLRRALFVCDRDELRQQALAAFTNIFGTDAAEVRRNPDGSNHAKNARIHIATYQTLDVASDEGSANFLLKNYPENYFSHIIIDECHRSAWGKWSQVLLRNPDAVQIGLTATPRQLKLPEKTEGALADEAITADNIRHFGEPVYEYDLAQGIEDGYLAACEVVRAQINIDETGLTIEQILALNPVDAITGQPLSREELEELYEKTSFENRIMLPDRVKAMCADLFQRLLETGGPEQKTVIFCVRDAHAQAVAREMGNLYAEWCRETGQPLKEYYAFKCTAASSGNDQLADLRGSSNSHFIASTVDLLTTGVDVPCLRNVVFFRYVQSPISFYQMVGRGTRIDLASDKLMFRVYDYTDASRLFGEAFLTNYTRAKNPTERVAEEGESPGPYNAPRPIPQVEGFSVLIRPAGRLVVAQVDGQEKLIPIEEYKERLSERLVQAAPDLEHFRQAWVHPDERRQLVDHLVRSGYSPKVVQVVEEMTDYDLYDVLAALGYGMNPLTRLQRAGAFGYKHRDWVAAMPRRTAATVLALANQFSRSGTEALENPQIFNVPEVVRAGGLPALKELGEPREVLRQTKERMFEA